MMEICRILFPGQQWTTPIYSFPGTRNICKTKWTTPKAGSHHPAKSYDLAKKQLSQKSWLNARIARLWEIIACDFQVVNFGRSYYIVEVVWRPPNGPHNASTITAMPTSNDISKPLSRFGYIITTVVLLWRRVTGKIDCHESPKINISPKSVTEHTMLTW